MARRTSREYYTQLPNGTFNTSWLLPERWGSHPQGGLPNRAMHLQQMTGRNASEDAGRVWIRNMSMHKMRNTGALEQHRW